MKYQKIREEELKNKIGEDYFWLHDTTKIFGNVDFCVSVHQTDKPAAEHESLLWAEAKKGAADSYKSIAQLVLTIGKARTFDKFLPPAFLGAFDAEKIAFLPYNSIQEVFYINDFNWNVAPSNHETKEFLLIYEKIKTTIDEKALLFNYENDDKELKNFIKENFITGKFGVTKTRIDKNNFITIYIKWLQTVKPTILINWDIAKKAGIIDGDFFLADLLSLENKTLKEKLFVLLNNDHYHLDKKLNEYGLFSSVATSFSDNQKAHTQFWNRYERPPKEEYWDYIVERRDLLVPQDVRERKGSFFTPQIWVELSQQYLTDTLGEDWQDEYYIWDCAAGTGNLLNGLTNKYHIWASTLDKQDVDVIHDRILNGANLLESHVFQFDFLNDDFTKLPVELQKIINDPEKRKKLVIYINPPYAEASDGIGLGGAKLDVSKETKMYEKYGAILKKGKNELFAQFLIRIYKEINGCRIAQFSTLKILQSSNFVPFRKAFEAKLEKIFVVPANTFDNVKGIFPIGFMIWDTQNKQNFSSAEADIYGHDGKFIAKKTIHSYKDDFYISDWIKKYINNENNFIGVLAYSANDFQHAGEVRLTSTKPTSHISTLSINRKNLIPTCVYLAVRHCITATWLNDRDQFLAPNNNWETDSEFQNDCLTFCLFNSQNKITNYNNDKINHWLPFTEYEVDAKEKFESNFMTKFINGKLQPEPGNILFGENVNRTTPLAFSIEATAVFDAGRELWKYYHKSIKNTTFVVENTANVNASLYDIRAYFQGRNGKDRMNSKSDDETYNELLKNLREKLKQLADKIEPKVYEYGFLKQ